MLKTPIDMELKFIINDISFFFIPSSQATNINLVNYLYNSKVTRNLIKSVYKSNTSLYKISKLNPELFSYLDFIPGEDYSSLVEIIKIFSKNLFYSLTSPVKISYYNATLFYILKVTELYIIQNKLIGGIEVLRNILIPELILLHNELNIEGKIPTEPFRFLRIEFFDLGVPVIEWVELINKKFGVLPVSYL